MQLVPLFEDDRPLPDLTPTNDLLGSMKTIKKTLLAWETQKDRVNYGELISYIDEVIKLNKQLP